MKLFKIKTAKYLRRIVNAIAMINFLWPELNNMNSDDMFQQDATYFTGETMTLLQSKF